MKPPLKRRIIEWLCDVLGHNNEYSHTYAGKKHYYCKRCGAHTEISLTWQERIVLENLEEMEECKPYQYYSNTMMESCNI